MAKKTQWKSQRNPMAVGAGREMHRLRGALVFCFNGNSHYGMWTLHACLLGMRHDTLLHPPPLSLFLSFSLSLSFYQYFLLFSLSLLSGFGTFFSHPASLPPPPHLLLTAPTSSSPPSVASRNHHLTDSITFNLNRGMQPKSPSMTPSPTFFGEALNASLQVIRHLWPPEPVTRSLLARYRHHDTSWHPAAVAHHGRPSPRQLSFRVIHSSSLKFTQVEPLSGERETETAQKPDQTGTLKFQLATESHRQPKVRIRRPKFAVAGDTYR